MLISKQLGVFINYVHNRFKLTVKDEFEKGGYNITPEQYLALDTIWDEGKLSQQKIATIMLKDKNSIVKIIDGLQAKGLVDREDNPKDRRENLVKATRKSLEIKDDINDLALRAVEKITDGIPKKDLETFITVLSRMASNMDAGIDLQEMARKFPSRRT